MARLVPAVKHGHQHALQLQLTVQRAADDADGVHQIAETLQSEIFPLDRNQHRVGGAQAIEGQQLQRGRAVDEYVVIGGGEGLQGLAEQELPALHADHLDAGAGQPLTGGQHVAVRVETTRFWLSTPLMRTS